MGDNEPRRSNDRRNDAGPRGLLASAGVLIAGGFVVLLIPFSDGNRSGGSELLFALGLWAIGVACVVPAIRVVLRRR
jgi:hypothetical protein